jgi:hypothetical protein
VAVLYIGRRFLKVNGKFLNKSLVGKPRKSKDEVVQRDGVQVLGI